MFIIRIVLIRRPGLSLSRSRGPEEERPWERGWRQPYHRTKNQESVNGNVAEVYETVAETRRVIRVSAVGFVMLTRVTAEPDNISHVSVRFELKETNVSASVTSC